MELSTTLRNVKGNNKNFNHYTHETQLKHP